MVSRDSHNPKAKTRPLVFGDTTPQPTQAVPSAGLEPLPSVELMRIVMDVEQRHHFLRGTTNWAVAVGRAIEAAHGIKGGQHGADET
ncbi:hypothetical protein [Acidovorax soli]|uniref:hypothetical protein n=1 Tax=Acidovorax soli TaxID=592050 RepID=UPI0032B23A4D